MFTWFATTLRQYPEIAIFLVLALGYYFGKFTFRGIGLGSVTATLLAGVLVGQLGITIGTPLKATVFLMFLFAVGYGVGPQFVRGVAKDGLPQAIFAVVQCIFCLAVPVAIAKMAGYDMGYAAGLYSGSQTISAAMGLSTDAINRLGLAADEAKRLLDSMPIAYAVTYMFGTVGSAIVIALLGPVLLRMDLAAACKEYEEKQGGTKALGGAGSAWHRWEVRAFQVKPGSVVNGLRAVEVEALIPDARIFVLRLRRNGVIEEATADTVLREGDVVALAGAREVLVNALSRAKAAAAGGDATVEPPKEVDDPELLHMPIEGIDIYVTNKEVDDKTLAELAQLPAARGVFLRKITRGAVATSIPILPNTKIYRGDILDVVGRTQDTAAVTKLLGVPDRPTRCCRRRIHRRQHHGRRTDRRAGVESGRSAADSLYGWRRAHRRARCRVVAVGAPQFWPHPNLDRLVHEFRRTQHFHRRRRHLRRPGFRQRFEDTGHRTVLMGSAGDNCAARSRHVHGQVHLPLPRCLDPRHRFRCAHHDRFARPGLRHAVRARFLRSATP